MRSLPIRLLSCTCGALFLLYVLVISVTVFYASWQTSLLSTIAEHEMEVSMLETEYYTAIETFTAVAPETRGLVNPKQVTYVTALGAPALSRAGE